jgi:hypothetical protein
LASEFSSDMTMQNGQPVAGNADTTKTDELTELPEPKNDGQKLTASCTVILFDPRKYTPGICNNPGSTAVLEKDRVTVSGRSQYSILGGHWDVTFCNPGVTPVMDI